MNNRELDALIAEKVMGLTVVLRHESYSQNRVVGDAEYARFEREHPYSEPPRLLPHFSSDLSDAMLIVETLHNNDGYIVNIHIGTDEVEVSIWENEMCIASGTADNIVESICLAAMELRDRTVDVKSW